MANYDGQQEIQAILTRLRKLCGGRVADGIEDDNSEVLAPSGEMVKVVQFDDTTGEIKPYLWVEFYAPYSQEADRIVGGGEEDQPHLLSGVIECWGATRAIARATGAAARKLMLGDGDGWRAHPNNATQMVLRGGGNFRSRDTAGSPTRFMEQVPFECLINMASDSNV